MTIREENKFNMYNAVKTVCDENKPYWEPMAAFARTYGQFTDKLAGLAPATSLKSQTTAGVTSDKAAKRETMCSLTAEMAAVLHAFADEKGNVALKTDVSYTYAAILRLRENAVTTVCRAVLKQAQAHKKDLVEYGVETAAIKNLEAAIAAYEAIQMKPRTVQAQTKNARQNVDRMIREIDQLLYNRLDKLMEGFRNKQPDFFNQYTTVRMIVDRGGSRKVAEAAKVVSA